jgi:DNA-binding transcriptional ArsR family regulator
VADRGLVLVRRLNITLYLYNMRVIKIEVAVQTLDQVFGALSDPTRRAILHRLAEGEATVMELARPFNMSQPAVSRHLKVLERARLIERRVDGTRRPCRLSPPGIDSIDSWLDMLRKALSKNYERLDAVLAAMNSNESAKGHDETRD